MDELEQVILDQSEEIARLREALTKAEGKDSYYQAVYDRIWEAWNDFAQAELGTASPSPLDLAKRPELARLWETIR